MVNTVWKGRTLVLNSKIADATTHTGSVRVLLVDDFAIFRSLVAEILNKQPEYHIVGEAGDGLEAVKKAKELQPDLVVLDIGLPELSGIEVARRIRVCSPGSAIVFLTSNNDLELARAGLGIGARGYVLKIDVVTELVVAAKEALLGKWFLSRRLQEASGNQDR
jgi:DNA-binding NarL/FixJ family response regulator